MHFTGWRQLTVLIILNNVAVVDYSVSVGSSFERLPTLKGFLLVSTITMQSGESVCFFVAISSQLVELLPAGS
jgi:hypothetical protein